MVLKERVILSYLKESNEIPSLNYEQKGNEIQITDTLGGRAYIVLKPIKDNSNSTETIPSFIDLRSVPFDKTYSEEAPKYKRRGFFRSVLKELHKRGFNTFQISMPSPESRAALKRMLEKGEISNPRGIRGLSVDEYPTIFDIEMV